MATESIPVCLYAVAPPRAASAHPRPLVRGRIELPKVVEIASRAVGIGSIAAEEPEISAVVGPARTELASSGNISGGGRSQRAVHAGLAGRDAITPFRAASVHPAPQIRGRIELPKVVEIARIAVGIEATAAEEPEITAGIAPARNAIAASGDVSGSRRSQRAVHSGWATEGPVRSLYVGNKTVTRIRIASAHPRPLVGGGSELPKVVEAAPIAVGSHAPAPE